LIIWKISKSGRSLFLYLESPKPKRQWYVSLGRSLFFHRGVIHGEEDKHITVRMKIGAAVKCVCHWFMDGRVTYEVNGKKSECVLFLLKASWLNYWLMRFCFKAMKCPRTYSISGWSARMPNWRPRLGLVRHPGLLPSRRMLQADALL
jgi:hypothetical protein